MTEILLRAYRVAPRKPSISVDEGLVTFRLPTWFGGRVFAVPVVDVGVVDLRLVDEPPDLEDVVPEEPVEVPYVYTTGPMTVPNIGFVFSAPVRLPPFRWLVRGQASQIAMKRPARGERPAGRFVDGMLLRAVDPIGAVDVLVGAGAAEVRDPHGWLLARRSLVTDAARIAEREYGDWRLQRLERISLAVAAAGAVAFAVGELWLGDGLAESGLAVGAGGMIGHQVVAWRSERAWFRSMGRD